MGPDRPKANLTLEEGRDIQQTVQTFCKEHGIKANYITTLENALKARVENPIPLLLLMGVIVSTGDRKILAIPEGSNYTIETGVFCAKYDNSKDSIDSDWCKALMTRVKTRLEPNFVRRILLVIPIDAPDSRKLKLVLHEGFIHISFIYNNI